MFVISLKQNFLLVIRSYFKISLYSIIFLYVSLIDCSDSLVMGLFPFFYSVTYFIIHIHKGYIPCISL